MTEVSKASLPKAIFLMGPTASGKTALAIELRKVLPVELISVDSALIYRGMDIGTAKPNADELRAAPHRLLDILDPAQAYSAADFRRDALAEMAEITAACEAKAVSESGKKLSGAAKNSYMKKCEAEAK